MLNGIFSRLLTGMKQRIEAGRIAVNVLANYVAEIRAQREADRAKADAAWREKLATIQLNQAINKRSK